MKRTLTLLTISAMLMHCNGGSMVADSGTEMCPTPTGTGTKHSSVTGSETWKAVDGPHVVSSDLTVAKGNSLTVEPCAVVRMQKGTRIIVEGNLVAQGTAAKPISFMRDADADAWAHLGVFAPGTMKLAYVSVSGGGSDTTNSYGLIEARGDQLAAAQPILQVDHVSVTNAVAYGVSLRAGAAFTADSTALSVSGSAKAPLRILPRLASNIPTGSFTGNTLDAIVVETEAYGDITLEDVTFHERGVPYRIGDSSSGTLKVGPGTSNVTLTLDPGVVFQFKKQSSAGLLIDSGSTKQTAKGTLVATGTAAKPIVFTSAAATPAAGDWQGLVFGNVPTATNHLEFVEVRFAGGPSFSNSFHCQPNGSFSANEDAAISFYGAPGASVLTNSTIADSAGLGVNLAYSGAAVDLKAGNTFTRLASCKQSVPRDAQGNCPASSTCD